MYRGDALGGSSSVLSHIARRYVRPLYDILRPLMHRSQRCSLLCFSFALRWYMHQNRHDATSKFHKRTPAEVKADTSRELPLSSPPPLESSPSTPMAPTDGQATSSGSSTTQQQSLTTPTLTDPTTTSAASPPATFDLSTLAQQLIPMITAELRTTLLPLLTNQTSTQSPPPSFTTAPPPQWNQTLPQQAAQATASTWNTNGAGLGSTGLGSTTQSFVGPLTSNPAAGTSLLRLFPEVEAATIFQIITHEFKAIDLSKLDSRLRDQAQCGYLEFDDGRLQLRNAEPTIKDYPTPVSVIYLLQIYFRILMVYANPTGKALEVALATNSYAATLLKFSTEFDWHAVLAYHLAFFNRRRRDMLDGNYASWGVIDSELVNKHLTAAVRKQKLTSSSLLSSTKKTDHSKEVCQLFNRGACTTPCRNGRIHKCSTPGCGRADHGAHACTVYHHDLHLKTGPGKGSYGHSPTSSLSSGP